MVEALRTPFGITGSASLGTAVVLEAQIDLETGVTHERFGVEIEGLVVGR